MASFTPFRNRRGVKTIAKNLHIKKIIYVFVLKIFLFIFVYRSGTLHLKIKFISSFPYSVFGTVFDIEMLCVNDYAQNV